MINYKQNNNMKKVTTFLITALLAINFAACGTSDSQLKSLVEEMNRYCPISMGTYATIDQMEYADKTVIFTYTFADGFIDLDAIKANDEVFRQNMLISYATNSEANFKKLIDYIIDANANLKLIFKCNNQSHTLLFTSDELEANRPGTDTDPMKQLRVLIDNAKIQMPQVVAQGMTMTDVVIEDKYVVYTYDCDDNFYDISLMKDNYSMMKNLVLEEIRQDNSIIAQMCKLLKEVNFGLAYKYTGVPSGKSCTIFVESIEL